MRTKLTTDQKKLLSDLIDLYENSKTYEGTNRINQSFYRLPSQIFREYDSDYADFELIQEFEDHMRELEEEGLIRIEWNGNVIKKLFAAADPWNRINGILKRTDKNTRISEEQAFYRNCLGEQKWISAFCLEQIERLEKGKKAVYPAEEAKELISLLKEILSNREELLERELSIRFFGDSKRFEKSYRSRVCRWLRKYGDFEPLLEGIDDNREAEQVILGEYNIFANPSYVYLKGNARLLFDSGTVIKTESRFPIALSSTALEHVTEFQIDADAVMTVENLTSFNRIGDETCFYVFLSGYHNTVKQRMLAAIYEKNENLKWFHFGDLDPDGLYILEHLKRGTGIPFEAYRMSVSDLERYKAYAKPLTEKDRVKAQSLLDKGAFLELISYMVTEGCKLEQEIISMEWIKREEKNNELRGDKVL